jgi:hypothetical protein
VTAYSTRHWRVRKHRRPANLRKCVYCAANGVDKQARDWAHLHDTNPEDVMNYIPLCRSCHIRYDRPARPKPYTAKTKALLNRKRRGGGLKGYKHTPEAIEKIREAARNPSADARAKMAAGGRKGVAARKAAGPMPDEQRAKLSAALAGNSNAAGSKHGGRRTGQALENLRVGQQRRREREQAEREAMEA